MGRGATFLARIARLRRPKARQDAIEPAVLDQLPLADIESVTFYKRDELATDLICCDVDVDGRIWFFHEEAIGWDMLLRHLEKLPGFRGDWYEAAVQPPFALCETVAFKRESEKS